MPEDDVRFLALCTLENGWGALANVTALIAAPGNVNGLDVTNGDAWEALKAQDNQDSAFLPGQREFNYCAFRVTQEALDEEVEAALAASSVRIKEVYVALWAEASANRPLARNASVLVNRADLPQEGHIFLRANSGFSARPCIASLDESRPPDLMPIGRITADAVRQNDVIRDGASINGLLATWRAEFSLAVTPKAHLPLVLAICVASPWPSGVTRPKPIIIAPHALNVAEKFSRCADGREAAATETTSQSRSLAAPSSVTSGWTITSRIEGRPRVPRSHMGARQPADLNSSEAPKRLRDCKQASWYLAIGVAPRPLPQNGFPVGGRSCMHARA